MPFIDNKRKQEERAESNSDLKLTGSQIILQNRPNSRPSSRTFQWQQRCMSVTPPLLFQEMHRKTPPWMRPQSADHCSGSTRRKKLAAKFQGANIDKDKQLKSNMGLGETYTVMSPLISSSVEELLEDEREEGSGQHRMRPGLRAKPPLPPNHQSSLDEIINIKFQRWFPEAATTPLVETYRPVEPSSQTMLTLETPTESLPEDVQTAVSRESPRGSCGGMEENPRMVVEAVVEEDRGSTRTDKKIKKVTIVESEDIQPPNLAAQSAQSIIQDGLLPITHGSLPTSAHSCLTLPSTVQSTLPVPANSHTPFPLPNTSQISFPLPPALSPNPTASLPPVSALSLEDGMQLDVMKPSHNEGELSNTTIPPAPTPASPSSATKFTPFNENGNVVNNDVLSWVENHTSTVKQDIPQAENVGGGSTYEDILHMLKILEKEEVESLKFDGQSSTRSTNNSGRSHAASVGARDILTFLDEVEHTNENGGHDQDIAQSTASITPAVSQSRGSGELVRQVLALTEELERNQSTSEQLQTKLRETEQKLSSTKSDYEKTIKRHQNFIDQLLTEKRVLGEQCAAVVKEMENKHTGALKALQDKHALEIRKQRDKMLAAEKIRREKWVDHNTKKIKELTVKGLEPELERLATVHQEELSEVRRAHDRELQEAESRWERRMAAARERAARERQDAVLQERQAAAHKMECEMRDLEKSYQEQRKRLLDEVREERERLEREAEKSLAERREALEGAWARAQLQLQQATQQLTARHQEELKEARESLEGEKKLWMDRQMATMNDKERTIKEACKKERDRHIETVVRRLEAEATDKERAAQLRLMRLKEQHEQEVKELEGCVEDARKKLREARAETDQKEEKSAALHTRICQLQAQVTSLSQKCERLEKDVEDGRRTVRAEVSEQVTALQRELREAKASHQEELASLRTAKELELHDVYTRVKEAVSKKEETIRLVQKQRDAALEQCSQLENLLQKKGFHK